MAAKRNGGEPLPWSNAAGFPGLVHWDFFPVGRGAGYTARGRVRRLTATSSAPAAITTGSTTSATMSHP